MKVRDIVEKEKRLWHRHFMPSVVAGIAIAVLAYLYEQTVSNIVLLSSVGATAMILANSTTHHLTKLHTALISYIFAALIALLLQAYTTLQLLSTHTLISITVFLVGLGLLLADTFHPPAISAAVSFVLIDQLTFQYVYLFVGMLLFFILIRLVTYLLSQQLSVRQFITEFKRHW